MAQQAVSILKILLLGSLNHFGRDPSLYILLLMLLASLRVGLEYTPPTTTTKREAGEEEIEKEDSKRRKQIFKLRVFFKNRKLERPL